MKLSGHKVLITGGSAGIGYELAREFLARGNKVAICGRDSGRLSKARIELAGVETIQCDLALPTDVEKLAQQAGEQLGGLSILVNNAGVQQNYSFVDVEATQAATDAAWEVQVNLTAVIALTALCLPMLRTSPSAAVVNVSSVFALTTPKASAAVYCASKAAVHSFSQALRYQFEDSLPNVQVYEVMPPLVDTAMTRGRGSGKLSPRQVAVATFLGLESDRYEIRVGKAKLLAALQRLAPPLTARILRNG